MASEITSNNDNVSIFMVDYWNNPEDKPKYESPYRKYHLLTHDMKSYIHGENKDHYEVSTISVNMNSREYQNAVNSSKTDAEIDEDTKAEESDKKVTIYQVSLWAYNENPDEIDARIKIRFITMDDTSWVNHTPRNDKVTKHRIDTLQVPNASPVHIGALENSLSYITDLKINAKNANKKMQDLMYSI